MKAKLIFFAFKRKICLILLMFLLLFIYLEVKFEFRGFWVNKFLYESSKSRHKNEKNKKNMICKCLGISNKKRFVIFRKVKHNKECKFLSKLVFKTGINFKDFTGVFDFFQFKKFFI